MSNIDSFACAGCGRQIYWQSYCSKCDRPMCRFCRGTQADVSPGTPLYCKAHVSLEGKKKKAGRSVWGR